MTGYLLMIALNSFYINGPQLYPANSTSSPNLEEHVKQFFAQEINMPRREIDDGMYATKLPQPNTVLINLSDHRFKIFLFRAKKQLRLSNNETYNDLFINENLTSWNY